MPRKRQAKHVSAASVRRRLVFDDDEAASDSVTFSVGVCVSDGGVMPGGVMPGHRGPGVSLPDASRSECEEFRDLLWSNPATTTTTVARDADDESGANDRRRYVRIKTKSSDSNKGVGIPRTLSCLVFLLCVVFILLSFVIDAPVAFRELRIDTVSEDGPYLLFKHKKVVSLLGLISSVGVASLFGLSCCAFSWIVIYFDSLKPGRIPPTPLSPSKYRRKSGHTFHLSYLMSSVCGLMVFSYYLWLSRDGYVI